MKRAFAVCALLGATLWLPSSNFAQDAARSQSLDKGNATLAAKSSAMIPLSTFSISPTKVNQRKPSTETIVGGNPFSNPPTGSTLNAVLVPMIFNIGGTIFDPTAPNSCDSGISVISRFNSSPLVQAVPNLTFNGVNVGTVQYTDGLMRAEFWNQIGGNPAYSNPISWSTAAPVTIVAGSSGIIYQSGCTMMGIVSQTFLNTQIASLLQNLTQSGVISPTKLVVFLTQNVVGSSASPPTPPGTSTCCNWGYHSATGSPSQFYIFADYKAAAVPADARDLNITIVSHEIAEFMNDPLLNNQTPAWGGIGSAHGCSSVLEVGDPLVAIPAPITMNGFNYNPQEMAYFSWFFNAPGTPSLGAGGIFSSNGSFLGPSKVCPPGGTY